MRRVGRGGAGAVLRSYLLASRAASLGRLRLPPIPRDGGRSPPCCAGRLARRRRPALRGALRLVGFAPDGYPPPTTPQPRPPAAPRSYFDHARVLWRQLISERRWEGAGHPPWTRIFCALPKQKTEVSWPVKSGGTGCESAWSAGDAPAPSHRIAGTSVYLRFVAVHHLVALRLHPLVDLLVRHEVGRIEAVPAHDLVQPLLPALVRGLEGRPKAHDVDDGQLLRHSEERPDLLLDVLLPDGRDPPDRIAQRGRGQVRGHGGGRHGLQQDPLGVLLVAPVEVRAVVEDGKGPDEPEVRGDHDEPGRRLHPVVVRRGKAHVQPGPVLLLVGGPRPCDLSGGLAAGADAVD